MTTACLIVAAGKGARLGSEVPKQYLPVGGQPLLRWSVERLLAHPGIDDVRVVIDPDNRAHYDSAVAGLDVGEPIVGGATRQASVLAGLSAAEGAKRVLIHDAARPFVTSMVVDELLQALDVHNGAVPGLPVVDSLRRGEDTLQEEVSRENLWRVQTPQAFRLPELLAAHREAVAGATDDAEIARRAGLSVAIVSGDETLFKVTHPADLDRAERHLVTRGVRTGMGYDVHRFGPGDHVWLCGVKVPHGQALAGHSDADVGLHALTDAVLGAIGAGDIGDHFPPSDDKWKGAASDQFLAHARDLVTAAGGRIENVDVTLICEAPKIGPHREAMRQRVADVLRLDPARTSVKATTTERLGFAGRREGIAAQAVATISI
ncbi:MAG: bifunctional 2-C-methyl-D-erythritol 4-phosphate cytidylyltransferase/2-C-methyl-D-erythritol 2,4-cyclodiphosphate synthase [Pacificimonas sp.]